MASIERLRTQTINYRRYYGNFELFIFVGACDLTVKGSDGILHLPPDPEKIEEKLLKKFRNFAHYARIKGFPETFLEVPAMCMQKWNKQHGHENPLLFVHNWNQGLVSWRYHFNDASLDYCKWPVKNPYSF